MPFPLFNPPACIPRVHFLDLKPVAFQFVGCYCSLALQVYHTAALSSLAKRSLTTSVSLSQNAYQKSLEI